MSSRESTPNSLFDEVPEPTVRIASRDPPPIPGLWVFPGLLPAEHATLREMSDQHTFADGRDQVMLFTRPNPHPSSLPRYLTELLDTTSNLLKDLVPPETTDVLFDQPLARQVILNLYPPGQGISPHIDLPNRYADGIIGVSLLGGCTMVFERDGERCDVYIPERTVYVLAGEARWEWSHGIEGRMEDKVRGKGEEEVETRLRSTRASVTFRWMRDGADVLV